MNLHFSDNTSEGFLAVANILQIRSKTSDATIANDSQQSFEIEMYNGTTQGFGCSDPIEKKRWLTAVHAAKAQFSISISSYKKCLNESNRQIVNDIVNYSDQFRRQVLRLQLSLTLSCFSFLFLTTAFFNFVASLGCSLHFDCGGKEATKYRGSWVQRSRY